MYLIVLGLLFVAVVFAIIRRAPPLPHEEFATALLPIKPTLWWITDDVLPRGYLEVAFEAVQRTQGADFNIRQLMGRDAVHAMLTDPAKSAAASLPPALWRNYAIASLLNAHGGLVMDGTSTLCVGPSFAPLLRTVPAAVFGVSADEPVVSPATAIAPGPNPYVGWARTAHHPAWEHTAGVWSRLATAGPQAWASAEARRTYMKVFEVQRGSGIAVIREADGGRLVDGRLRTLDDLFERIAEPADPKQALLPGVVYVPYDSDALSRRFELNWFLRLSPEQIKSSDIVWARLAGY
jgi:hypothetical protein